MAERLRSGTEPGLQWWEANALTTALMLPQNMQGECHYCYPFEIIQVPNQTYQE